MNWQALTNALKDTQLNLKINSHWEKKLDSSTTAILYALSTILATSHGAVLP
ncbi:MAG: hypothetical protein ACKO24_17510 [Leptolyngbyaceae cyanobacterium]